MKEEERWHAERDAETLLEYQKLKDDNERMKKAIKVLSDKRNAVKGAIKLATNHSSD